MNIEWSIATAKDIDEYYGERPRFTLKAIAIRMDAKPVAIIGLLDEKHRMRAFSEYKPELEPYLKSMTVLRAVKASQHMIATCGKQVIAIGEGCSGILERVGFVCVQDDVYVWSGA